MTSTPRPLKFIDQAANLLTARGWNVNIDTTETGCQTLFASNRNYDRSICVGAYQTRTGWRFNGVTIYNTGGNRIRRSTYSDAYIVLDVYATDYVALDARRAAREVAS